MEFQKETLKRTEIKYLGCYLLDSGGPGRYVLEHNETETEMLKKAYQQLEDCLENLEPEQVDKILDAANAVGADSRRAGFFCGLKAGARLLRNLLDGGEIIF